MQAVRAGILEFGGVPEDEEEDRPDTAGIVIYPKVPSI